MKVKKTHTHLCFFLVGYILCINHKELSKKRKRKKCIKVKYAHKLNRKKKASTYMTKVMKAHIFPDFLPVCHQFITLLRY